MARYADVPDELERHLETRTPAWAAAITGLDEEAIVGFARLYGSTRRSFLRLGYGFSRSRNGSAQMHAVSCLPVVTGAWAHEGGGALYSNSAIYRLDKTLIEGRDRLTRRSGCSTCPGSARCWSGSGTRWAPGRRSTRC